MARVMKNVPAMARMYEGAIHLISSFKERRYSSSVGITLDEGTSAGTLGAGVSTWDCERILGKKKLNTSNTATIVLNIR